MRKHKFTWIDALVLVVIIGLIAGTCVKFFGKETTAVTQETVDVQFRLQISSVRQATIDALQVGDTVWEEENGNAVGVITEILVEPSLSSYAHDDGTIQQIEVEGRYNVTLTISAQGVVSGQTYKIGTHTLYINYAGTYFTKYSTWSAKIISID